MVYYVYVLENQADKSFYIGFTSDLKRRLFEHQNQKGGRTTKNGLLRNPSRGTATKNI
ncbi:MAG: GIY-YIG nuclease family protein, partial [Patescibacteria group bacterium]